MSSYDEADKVKARRVRHNVGHSEQWILESGSKFTFPTNTYSLIQQQNAFTTDNMSQ